MADTKIANFDDEQSAILQALLNTAVDAIITIDHRGMIRSANAAVEKMFGYSTPELRGKNISMLMPSPMREEHDQYLKKYLETGHAKIIGSGREVVAKHKNGNSIDVDLAVSEVKVGNETLFTGIIRDMTSRNLARDTARRERTFADNLVETANAIVVVLNEEGEIARINPFMEELSGYKCQEVQGQDWFEQFVPEEYQEEQRNIFQKILKENRVRSHLSPIKTKAGAFRTITWSGRVLHDADDVGEGVLAIGNDITELKQAEEHIIAQERLAAIGQMVTGLAHESRNALQRARASLDVLELDAHTDSRKLIIQAQSALNELQTLYEEVRHYAAPIILDKSKCDLLKLCRLTWAQLELDQSEQNVELVIESETESLNCECDHLRLRQVLRNVFENSLAVSPAGMNIQIRVHVDPIGMLQLIIRDHGPGFSPEQLENIFNPFYTTKTKGTGLGMAISKRIIDAHGGQIQAKNSDSGGAEIHISLPVN